MNMRNIYIYICIYYFILILRTKYLVITYLKPNKYEGYIYIYIYSSYLLGLSYVITKYFVLNTSISRK